jgi:hypothetical protein
MKPHHITRIILAAALAAIVPLSVPAAKAEDKPVKTSGKAAGKAPAGAVKKSMPPTQSEGRSTVASGAVEDTRDACLTRIPKDATAGQRMIAEQSCTRDQTSRQSMSDVPGR